MDLKTKDEKTLRKYLLGAMTAEEQEEIDSWLMSNEEAYDLIEAAEDDLIDDSLAGNLKSDELDRFNTHFLAAAERRRKLQFSRSLQKFIATSPNALGTELAPRTGASFWEAALDFLRYRPVIGYAASALVIVLAMAGVWSVSRVAALQRELRSASAQLTDVERQREEFKRQLDESQSVSEKLQTQFRSLEETVNALKSSSAPQAFVAVNLIPSLSRSSSDIPKVTTTPNVRVIQFSLVLLDDNYNSYRVALVDTSGRELWVRDRLPATATTNGKAVVLTVPSELLSSGDYSLSLAGISDSNPPENINSFYFRAVRQ